MKKVYETPSLELLSVEACTMLASSPGDEETPSIGTGSGSEDPGQAWTVESRDWDNIWQQ